jgi:DNA-binding response OmpR family regulator
LIVTSPILVFVVEDENLILEVIEEALSEGGYKVISTGSGEDALTKLDAEGVTFAALVTDINLSGALTGWDVARRARELNDTLPVLYVSGSDGHDWASKGVPNSLMLAKPFAVAQIVTAVSQMINDVPPASGTT